MLSRPLSIQTPRQQSPFFAQPMPWIPSRKALVFAILGLNVFLFLAGLAYWSVLEYGRTVAVCPQRFLDPTLFLLFSNIVGHVLLHWACSYGRFGFPWPFYKKTPSVRYMKGRGTLERFFTIWFDCACTIFATLWFVLVWGLVCQSDSGYTRGTSTWVKWCSLAVLCWVALYSAIRFMSFWKSTQPSVRARSPLWV